jgi:hypothetical protein
MKRSIFRWTMSAVTISIMSALPALAAQHGRGGPPKVKQGHAVGATSHGGGSTKTHTTIPAGHGHANAHTTAATTKVKTSGKTTTTTRATAAPTTGTLTPVQQTLQRNTKLADKLQGRLPAGTDLLAASADFRNLGQFVAAVNVSNNLGLTFTDLKTRMVDEHMSLGQAIQDVRGGTDGEIVALRAEQDADRMIRSTGGTTTSTTTTTAKPNGKSKAKPRKTPGIV